MTTTEADPKEAAVAAALGDGNIRVIGAPGSGKTRLAIEMFAALAERDGVDAVRLITPTRQAATRLRDELSFRVNQPSRGPLAKSISALAFEVLSEARGPASPVRLLSGGEQDYDIREVLEGEVKDGTSGYWPEKLGPEVRELLEFRTQLRDLLARCRDLDLVLARTEDETKTDTPFSKLRDLGKKYEMPEWESAADFFDRNIDVLRLAKKNQLDPTELINEATSYITDSNQSFSTKSPEAAAKIPQRVNLIVDDIHGFSPSQWRFIEAWSRSRGKIIVLGDPDLRVVGFKGTAQVLLDNDATEPKPESGWQQTIQLPEIHRQSGVMPTVLGQIAAATLAAGDSTARSAYPSLNVAKIETLRKLPGFELKTGLAVSAQGERQIIAQYLRSAIGSGVLPADCAVLVRDGATAEAIVEYLGSVSIPAFTETTGRPLRDHPVVWSLLTIVNIGIGLSELTPDVAERLLRGPFGGVTAIDYRRFRRALRKIELGAGGKRYADELMLEALRTPGILEEIDFDVPRSFRWLARTLVKLEEHKGASVDELLWIVWNNSKKAEEWATISALGGADAAWANESLDVVLALFAIAATALENEPAETVSTFMHRVLKQTVPNDSLTPRFTSGAVFVGTPTAAAGMEFDTVVVAGLNDGVWPNTRTRSSLLSANQLAAAAAEKLVKLPAPGSQGRLTALSERYRADHSEVLRDEIRLFLIAMSRAKRATLVTAVMSEEESPSPLFRMIAGEKDTEEKTPKSVPANNAFGEVFDPAEISGSLPQLVGSLRAQLLKENTTEDAKSRAALMLKELANRGVRGADPKDWLGMRAGTPQPLFQNTDIKISPSTLQDFEESALDWFVKQVAGGESGIPASIGTMVHSALEKNPFGTVSELEDDVMEHWSDLGFDVPWVDKFWRKKLDGMLVGMAEYVSFAKAQNREVLAKEQIFTVKLDIPNSENKILITGSIDRIEKTEKDTILIIDFKTGTPKSKLEANIEEHRQLQSYQLAYRIGELSNRDGNIVERGLSVESAALIYPTPKAVRNKHKMFRQKTMTDDQFEDFKKHLVAVAESMKTTNFSGKAEVDDDFGDGNKFKQKLFRTPEVSSDA